MRPFAFDFMTGSGRSGVRPARLAQRVGHSELHLVHVFPKELTGEQSRDLVGHLRIDVNEKAVAANGFRGKTVGIHLRAGKTVREIMQLATEVHADLIVLGSHKGPHLKHRVVGARRTWPRPQDRR